ncbi:MAG: translocation/assembly module TamB domain-containing protein, partial [Myxococcales bacterium]|nr:translocation/assembly module TamB domain-containing protein [Myxococcales bacterium]
PREVVPALGEARGRLDLEAELARQGHTLEAKLEGRARGLALAPARPTVDAAFTVDLTPARLTTTASVSGPEVGAVTLRHQGRPPARMDSGPAWQASLHHGLLEALTVDLHQLSLASAQAAVGQPLVATGEVDGQLQVDGSRTRAWVMGRSLRINKADAPQASLRIDAGHDPGRAFARAALDGAPFGTGTVSATISAPRELLDTTAWAEVDHRAVQALRADLSGLHLSLLARLGLAPELEGLATARLVARDHLHALDADVTVERVRVPQVPGEWSAESRARLVPTPGGAPGEGDLTLALDLRRNARAVAHLAARAPLPLDRIIQAPALAQDIPLEADAQIEALPLPALAQAAGVAPTMMQGALTASVAVAGTARAPRGQAVVRLDDLVLGETRFPRARLDARLRGRRVAARLSLEDQAGGALDADAEAGLDPGPVQANLRATGLELGAVSRMGLLPVGMDGRLFADVHVQGPPAELWPEGWAEVRELRLVFSQAALQPVREGLARLELGPRTARVTMSGGSGGGKLDFSADANVPVEAPVTFTAKAKMQKYPVAAGGSLVRVDLEANAEGKRDADGTSVQVRLQDGFVHVPEEKAEDLHPIEAPEDVVYVDTLPGGKGRTRVRTSSVAAGPPTVVHIETVAPIDVRGGPVDAALEVELDAKAAGGKSALTGRVLTTDGALTLFRRRYIIERAQLIFDGQDPPDPRVSVRLRHDFPTLTFTVMVEGTANQPEVSFDASPSRYSQGELLSIFLGTDPEDLGKKDDRSVSQQAVGAVAGLLVGRLQEQLGQALPIDTLDVELGDTTTGAGTRVTLGKWITRKLFLAYRYKFQADTQVENDSEAVVQYRFLPGWMVEVILGLVRNDAELVWMKRF